MRSGKVVLTPHVKDKYKMVLRCNTKFRETKALIVFTWERYLYHFGKDGSRTSYSPHMTERLSLSSLKNTGTGNLHMRAMRK